MERMPAFPPLVEYHASGRLVNRPYVPQPAGMCPAADMEEATPWFAWRPVRLSRIVGAEESATLVAHRWAWMERVRRGLNCDGRVYFDLSGK